MKKGVSLILAIVLCLGMCACDGKNVPGTTKIPTQTTEMTETPTETTQKPNNGDNASADTSWIVGDWTTVAREDDRDHGGVVSLVTEITYGFGAAGMGSINERGWIGLPGGAWEIAGMGFVETYFTYTLEGDTLSITHTGNEFETYPEEEKSTEVYTVVRNQDGSITWISADGRENSVLRQVEEHLTVEALLLLFGLNPNVLEK